jgi:hypothetical protein
LFWNFALKRYSSASSWFKVILSLGVTI